MSNMSRGRKLPEAKSMTAKTNNAAKQLGVKAKSMSAETNNDAKRMGLKPKDMMMKKPESGGTPKRIRTKNPPGGSETPGEKAKRKRKK
jgi:hypothetical protein